jgi:hypothetical protein
MTVCFFLCSQRRKIFSIRFFLSGSCQRKKLGKKETPPCTRSGSFLEVSKKQAKTHRTLTRNSSKGTYEKFAP